MQLKHKETGKIYNVTLGKIMKAKDAKKKNVTASFLDAKADDGEEVGVVFGYTKDGKPSPINEYELILEKGEKL